MHASGFVNRSLIPTVIYDYWLCRSMVSRIEESEVLNLDYVTFPFVFMGKQ